MHTIAWRFCGIYFENNMSIRLERRDEDPSTLCIAFRHTPFGDVLIAATEQDEICYLTFADDRNLALAALVKKYPKSALNEEARDVHELAIQKLLGGNNENKSLTLSVKGSLFQFNIWKMLVKIPLGHCVSYTEVASKVGKPGASRAVGTAIGANDVAMLIPCHRVVRKDGMLGGYRWTIERKSALIDWEKALVESRI